MNQEIENWITGGEDFAQGIAIYDRLGPSATLKRVFARAGKSDANVKTLKYELSKLCQSPVPRIRINRIPVPPIRPKVSFSEVTTSHRPNTPEVNQFKERLIFKLKERDRLHFMLSENLTDVQRLSFALSILSISDEITDMYLSLDQYNKNGKIPFLSPEPKPEVESKFSKMDQAALYRSQILVRSYVSLYTRKLRESKTPKNSLKYADKLDHFKGQLSEIESLIVK